MSSRLKKILLLALAGLLLAGSGLIQNSMNGDRARLGLTRVEPLENAPPVLAFTTMALGGFRGLISNVLWIRANDLQDEDKFFEMAQLADWITKLEPHFVQVWLVQGWNMAYNISVKFKDFEDRWRWVRRGIELLRDDGLRFNPNETLIYRELAWFFQHKMGANLDDASLYYKQAWSVEMAEVFGKKTPNLEELIHPQTDDQKRRARLLREKYKMDPAFMKVVDERHGPLEWRLPESHAIYWASVGLQKAQENPSKVKPEELIMLRRVIYQSMQMSFLRGRLIVNSFAKRFEFGPNLDIVPKVSAAYEQAAREDAGNAEHILRAHRNFLRDAVYFLYEHNRVREAATWFAYLGKQYPDKALFDGKPDSIPGKVTLEEYCIQKVQEDITETSPDRARSAISGMLLDSYGSLVLDEDDRAEGLTRLARQVYNAYQSRVPADRQAAIGLPPLEDIARDVREHILDPESGWEPQARAILRTKLRLPAETPRLTPPAGGTNAPPTRPQGS